MIITSIIFLTFSCEIIKELQSLDKRYSSSSDTFPSESTISVAIAKAVSCKYSGRDSTATFNIAVLKMMRYSSTND